MREEQIDQAHRRTGPRECTDPLLVLTPKVEQSAGPRGRIARLFHDALGDEADPTVPSAAPADGEQMLAVLTVVLFQVVRQVEQGLGEQSPFAEHQREEQSPDAAVAIHEGVDCLELIMHEREIDDDGSITGRVEKPLEVFEQRRQPGVNRGDKSAVVPIIPLAADADIAMAEFAGAFIAAANPGHEHAVDYPDDPERKGLALPDEFQAVLGSEYVVLHLLDIGGVGDLIRLRFEQEQLIEPGDRPFDAARRDGFPLDERADQQMGIGEHPTDAGQFADGPFGFRQGSGQREIEPQRFQGWRERVRLVRPKPLNRPNQPSRGIGSEVDGTQASTPSMGYGQLKRTSISPMTTIAKCITLYTYCGLFLSR